MLTRRALLRSSALISLAPALPAFLMRTAWAAAADRDGRVLVVIQLDGGNDGINTVVPFADDAYARCRRELRIPREQLCKINDQVGLHPVMKPMAEMLEQGRFAVVQGVGYPNPNRSHFKSMAIWQTARLDPVDEAHGWLGRALDDHAGVGNGPSAVFIGEQDPPRALRGSRSSIGTFSDATDLVTSLPAPPVEREAEGDLDNFVKRTVTGAYATAAELEAATRHGADAGVSYPATQLGQRLELIARSLKAGSGARVYYVIQPGYDTHVLQLPSQAALLGEFAGAVRAFTDDLKASKLDDRVVLLAFSEFGRRPEENGSLGTDHGTAGPVFLAGPAVRAGLVGETPRLGDLKDGDLKWSIEFRRVYATLLEGWLGVQAEAALGGRFEHLPLLKV